MAAKRTLLVDADIVAFKFAAKGQRKYAFGTAVDDLASVGPKVDEYLADMQDHLKATGLIICLSSPSDEGWRKDVLPSYKEHRAGVVRPELLDPIKDYLEASYPSYRRPRLEADDIMGILATMDGLPGNFVRQYPEFADCGQKVIVSEDKDMKTIPGWLYNPAKDSKPRKVSLEEADWWHLYQTIVGDTTDGYKGAPGAGIKKAREILGELEARKYIHVYEAWPRIVELFASKGLTEADALVQARVARICRLADYDFENKRVIHWTPPTN